MNYNLVVEKDVCKVQVNLTLTQFEILEDVLSEIGEFREYLEDEKTLEELKDIFNYSNYLKIREIMEG